MFFLSIIGVILTTIVIFALTGGLYAIARVMDLATLLLLLIIFIPLLVSSGLWKDFNNAFRLGIGKKKAAGLLELKRAKEAVGLSIKIIVAGTVFIMAVSAVQVLYMLESPALLGPNLAVIILSLVYGMFVVLILLPLQSILNVKIQEYISAGEMEESADIGVESSPGEAEISVNKAEE